MNPTLPAQPSVRIGDNVRIIFLHHSTGRNLIRQGGVRNLITRRNESNGTKFEFWDHDYNEIGLTGPTGKKMGVSFNVPDDNTDPDGLDTLFSQPVHDPPDNALSHLLTYDVVILKSCFPASAIHSQQQLEESCRHYRSMREKFSQHPRILFMLMTSPPLVPHLLVQKILPRSPESTNQADARRARELSRWLVSEDFLMNLPNVTTFDFFDLLAEPANSRFWPNTLRAEYRSGRLRLDSHPNQNASRRIAPLLVDWIWESIEAFQLRSCESQLTYSV